MSRWQLLQRMAPIGTVVAQLPVARYGVPNIRGTAMTPDEARALAPQATPLTRAVSKELSRGLRHDSSLQFASDGSVALREALAAVQRRIRDAEIGDVLAAVPWGEPRA